MVDAAQIAGLNCLRLMNETAAGLYWALLGMRITLVATVQMEQLLCAIIPGHVYYKLIPIYLGT